MSWQVKKERPEETTSAIDYYASEAQHYESPGMVREQERITRRALELLELKKGKVLDVGCGTGISTLVLKQAGFEVTGIDPIESMLATAKERGLSVMKGTAEEIPLKEKFDAIVSISALQWVKEYAKAAKEFRRVLKKSGRGVVQFYPKSEGEMLHCAKAFKTAGFSVKLAIDSPENPRKRKIFMVLEPVVT